MGLRAPYAGPPPPRSQNAKRSLRQSRKRTTLDWMAVAAEEHGREILEVSLQAMRGGDWRAAEVLMSRIYGKPTETTPSSPERAVLASMTIEEKREELLHKPATRRAGGVSVVEPVRSTE